MTESVVVQTPARAHLGLLQTAAAFGRRNMGVGLALTNPNWTLLLTPARHDEIVGDVADEPRVRSLEARPFHARP